MDELPSFRIKTTRIPSGIATTSSFRDITFTGVEQIPMSYMDSLEANTIIGVALFGLGRIGATHFKNVICNPRCRLRYVIEMDMDVAETLVNKYHMTNAKVLSTDEADQAYGDPKVHAVLVCSPTFTHENIIKLALKHGKSVFCEKPVCDTSERISRCYEMAQRAKLRLFCSFNRRFDPNVRGIKDRVTAGEIGKVHVIKTCSRDHTKPPPDYLKLSGGIFHDCAIHDLDMVCWLAEEFPVTVYVQGTANDPDVAAVNDVDTVLITLKFPSGLLALIDISRHATYGYDQRVEVNGSSSMVTSENQVANGVVKYNKCGVHGSTFSNSFIDRYAASYAAAMEHFFDLLQDKVHPVVKDKEVINASKLADACAESYRTDLPVTINYQ